MSRTPLFDALKTYQEESRGFFRIPGHRFERGIPEAFKSFAGPEIFRLDVTETPLTDDLHNPQSVIAESQRQTAEAFGANQSFYLVNGTTCGNQSMILATVREGEKILLPRNAHKSVLSGLIISGAVPVYYKPHMAKELGIPAAADTNAVESALRDHPDTRVVFAVSPSYHGFCSDIESLADSAHSRDIPLIVDEAHGPHLYFSPLLPAGALESGADACAQSLHKTSGALTQASLLHCNSARIDAARLDAALRMTMSTSPSYLLMTSLETARAEMETRGDELWEKAVRLARYIRNEVEKIPGLSTIDPENHGIPGCCAMDPTRVVLRCGGLGLSGSELKKRLWKNYRIDVEMADPRSVLLLVSYGNTIEEAEALLSALRTISESMPDRADGHPVLTLPETPPMALTPRQAFMAAADAVPLGKIQGRIAAEMAAPYPPGIPIVYPGEVITAEIAAFMRTMKASGGHFHGPADKSLSTFRVCSE